MKLKENIINLFLIIFFVTGNCYLFTVPVRSNTNEIENFKDRLKNVEEDVSSINTSLLDVKPYDVLQEVKSLKKDINLINNKIDKGFE